MWKWRNLEVMLLLSALLPAGALSVTAEDLSLSKQRTDCFATDEVERPSSQHVFGTHNFLIHYDTEGQKAVYNSDIDADPSDGVPDYINRMAEYFEKSWATYIEELGYDPPPPDNGLGGDDRYDIYVTRITGRTEREFPSIYYPNREAYASYIFIGNDMRNEHHPNDPYPFLKVTCAHEFYHAVQLAYRGNPMDETSWWYELTAVWAEDLVFDEVNEHYYYLSDYFPKIHNSIYLSGPPHSYGAWVFAEYLSERYGKSIIREVFEKLKTDNNESIFAINDVLSDYMLEFNIEFSLFSGWNYFTAENYKDGFYEEGEAFPISVPISDSHYYYPVNWINNQIELENLGISYIYFGSPDIPKGDLVISFQSSENYPEGVCLAGIYDDRPISLKAYKLDANETYEFRVTEFDHCYGAVLAINWSYQGFSEIENTAGYKYSAYIDSLIDGIAEGEPPVPGEFTIIGNHPNPFNLATEITFYWNSNPSYYNISIYDITGRQVEAFGGSADTGINQVKWKANDDLTSGVYFYRLSVDDNSLGGRMLLLK